MPDDHRREREPVQRPGPRVPRSECAQQEQDREHADREKKRVPTCLRPLDDERVEREQHAGDERDAPVERLRRARRSSAHASIVPSTDGKRNALRGAARRPTASRSSSRASSTRRARGRTTTGSRSRSATRPSRTRACRAGSPRPRARGRSSTTSTASELTRVRASLRSTAVACMSAIDGLPDRGPASRRSVGRGEQQAASDDERRRTTPPA